MKEGCLHGYGRPSTVHRMNVPGSRRTMQTPGSGTRVGLRGRSWDSPDRLAADIKAPGNADRGAPEARCATARLSTPSPWMIGGNFTGRAAETLIFGCRRTGRRHCFLRIRPTLSTLANERRPLDVPSKRTVPRFPGVTGIIGSLKSFREWRRAV